MTTSTCPMNWRLLTTALLAVAGMALLGLPGVARASGHGPAAAVVRQDLYGFTLPGCRVNHQGHNRVSITVLYRYRPGLPSSEYPDVLLVRKDLLQAIHSYPNTTDYWEVFNRHITDGLFRKYGDAMDALRVQMDILPHGAEPFQRTTLAISKRRGASDL